MHPVRWLSLILLPFLAGCESKPLFTLGYLPAENDRAIFSARPASAEGVISLKAIKADDAALAKAFRVIMRSDEPAASTPSLLGAYRVTNAAILFEPRFPLEPGATYEAMFNAGALPGVEGPHAEQRLTVRMPATRPLPATQVSAVYPSADELPENLLRMYIHFTAPMSQGDSYRYIHLLDERGKAMALPFLELPEELWNIEGTRLTILFDPGRVKQGLKPREDEGAVLEAGKRYTLVIDAAWRDANGTMLKEGFRKPFTATKADTAQPAPGKWDVKAPPAGTRRALVIRFGDALDHGMLEHMLAIRDADNATVSGAISIDEDETRWSFIPEKAWSAGQYTVHVPHTLEDRAGNSVGRPFEVDLNAPPLPEAMDQVLMFEVK